MATTTTTTSSSASATNDKTNNDTLQASSSSSPAWHNWVAGGVAGAGSRMATAPLDLIRIRRQLQATTVVYPAESMWASWKKIMETEKGGIAALYRGNTAAIYLWISYAAVQFAVYTPVRAAWKDLPGAAFGAGAVAGVCATLATYPFDVCRTTFAARGLETSSTPPTPTATTHMAPHSSMLEPAYPTIQQAQSQQQQAANTTKIPRTMGQFVVQLWRSKGIAGFYAGAGPAVAQIIPYMGLNFGIYDALTTHQGLSSASAGAISGAVSKLIIYPVDTVKRRLQAAAFFDNGSSSLVVGSTQNGSTTTAATSAFAQQHRVYRTVMELYEQGGWRSFYRGVFPSLLKTTIATSLSFSLFRGVKDGLAAL